MFIEWNSKEKFAVPYFQIRYHCPCAVCVDEHTGKRVLKQEDLDPLVKPTGVRLVGRYAVQIDWSDSHSTGMFHFETLYEISKGLGKAIP